MKVFEDLIEELKEENLLEETVIDLRRSSEDASLEPNSQTAHSSPHTDGAEAAGFELAGSDESIEEPEAPIDECEFYRKRAMEEVSSLQMVEHVLSGIEREHMKMSPASFDDLAVKKALHRFLQVSSDLTSSEYSEAEMALMQETESWFTALAKRDMNISVANLRRFCENSRPVLSSQALIALARFYRNSPYSEPVRGKFDFVMTRLFTRELGEERRKLLFGRGEMIGHIRNLYTNWSSLALFPAGEDSEGVAAAVERFNGFVAEAETSPTFDALIASDFFNRIRLFKEETHEMFLASEVTASAIESNVRVGNRFVELLRAESEETGLESIEAKYGYTYDTVISNATSKTLLLVEILKEEQAVRAEAEPEPEPIRYEPPPQVEFERAPVEEVSGVRLFTYNKWLMGILLIVLLLSGGVYLWSENAAQKQGDIAVASTIEISDPDLRQHLRLARASNETLYGVAQPSWDAQTPEEQKELLRKAFVFAKTVNMKRVNILNNKGRTIGYISADRVEVFKPQ